MAGSNSKSSEETGYDYLLNKCYGFSDNPSSESTARSSLEKSILSISGTEPMSLPLLNKDSDAKLLEKNGRSLLRGRKSSPPSECPNGMEDLILVYEDQADKKKIHTPEERLQYGVLTNALQDLKGPVPEHRREAKRWIDSNDKDHIFTFVCCCETFDLDPGCVRAALFHKEWDEFTLSYKPVPYKYRHALWTS